MPTTPVTDWGTALLTSTAAAIALLLGAIPKILAFVAIIVIGWLIASAVAGIVGALLRSIRFDDLARRSGIAGLVEQTGARTDSAGLLALITKWFIRLIALVVAFDALGVPAVSQVLQDFVLWLPNLVVALVVLVIGGLAANALAGAVRGAVAQSGVGQPNLLASIARVAVWAFAIVIAVNQIGIATTLVNILFMATVGALALALGLAFGLGGRETAGEIVRNWYQRSQAAAPRLEAVEPAHRPAGYSTATPVPPSTTEPPAA